MTDKQDATAVKPDAPVESRPEWIWYCESTSGIPLVTFGRWAKVPQQARYKLAEIQPTEHDHPGRSSVSSTLDDRLHMPSAYAVTDKQEQDTAGVRVKPLEWEQYDTALTPFGTRYAVYREYGRGRECWAVNVVDGAFDTPELAKAAAQADYERRILSALTTS